jgi:hypothetical protein
MNKVLIATVIFSWALQSMAGNQFTISQGDDLSEKGAVFACKVFLGEDPFSPPQFEGTITYGSHLIVDPNQKTVRISESNDLATPDSVFFNIYKIKSNPSIYIYSEKMGLDPLTHRPKDAVTASGISMVRIHRDVFSDKQVMVECKERE